jgi:DNA-binding MarR family transcriptional regulator
LFLESCQEVKIVNNQNQEDFLIGSLLRIPTEMLSLEIKALRERSGLFPDIRPIHEAVFLHLPPEGCRITELAEHAHMTRQAITYLVDHLIEHDYLERVDDPSDKRAQTIRRTQKGWEFHGMTKQHVLEIQQRWTEQFGKQEMQQLLSLLRRLVHEVLNVEYRGSLSALSDVEPEAAAETIRQQRK